MKREDKIFEELKAGYVDYTNTSGCSSHRSFLRLHLAAQADEISGGDTASARRLSPALQRHGAVERRRRRNNRPGMAG